MTNKSKQLHPCCQDYLTLSLLSSDHHFRELRFDPKFSNNLFSFSIEDKHEID